MRKVTASDGVLRNRSVVPPRFPHKPVAAPVYAGRISLLLLVAVELDVKEDDKADRVWPKGELWW